MGHKCQRCIKLRKQLSLIFLSAIVLNMSFRYLFSFPIVSIKDILLLPSMVVLTLASFSFLRQLRSNKWVSQFRQLDCSWIFFNKFRECGRFYLVSIRPERFQFEITLQDLGRFVFIDNCVLHLNTFLSADLISAINIPIRQYLNLL